MEHHFDIYIAKEYGVYEAILINNFMFWILKNKANSKHFYQGRYWTYNSVKALSELFPYMSEGQIRRTIDKLVDSGILLKGNFNQSPYDKTMWYAIDENKLSICVNDEIDLMNSSNGSDEINKPIPYNKQDNNTNSNTYNNKKSSKKELINKEKYIPVSEFENISIEENKLEEFNSTYEKQKLEWMVKKLDSWLETKKKKCNGIRSFKAYCNNWVEESYNSQQGNNYNQILEKGKINKIKLPI